MKNKRTVRHILTVSLSLWVASMAAGAASPGTSNYVFTTIDHPQGANGTYAQGVNAWGVIVGGYWDSNNRRHSYLLKRGVFNAIDHPLGVNGTYARGVNDWGAVVGYYVDENFVSHGFVLWRGAYSTLDHPLANGTVAYGISVLGEVVGAYFDATGQHGFRFKHGVFTTIDDPLGADPDCGSNAAYAVNASGVVVGEWDNYCGDAPYQNGYLLKDGIYTTLNHPSTGGVSFTLGINDRGAVTGWFEDTRGAAHGYVLDRGIYTEIAAPLFPAGTLAQGINIRGQVVGGGRDASGLLHGFIATPGRDCR